MIDMIHSEVFFAAGYIVFLTLAAIGFEWMTRFSHRQTHRFKTVGFHFNHRVKAWECSQGSLLWLQEIDHRRKLARYKANAHTCNKCSIKSKCTDSNDGRELIHSLNSWVDTEMGQFQRSISLMLIFLAFVILIVELIRHHNQFDLLPLGLSMIPLFIAGIRNLKIFIAVNLKISRKSKIHGPFDVNRNLNAPWEKRWW